MIHAATFHRLSRIGRAAAIFTAFSTIAYAQTIKFREASSAVAELEDANIEAEITGASGRTTFHYSFRNPNDKTADGTFELPLANGQRVTAFAVEVGPQILREAVPLSHPLVRTVFEDLDTKRATLATDALQDTSTFRIDIPSLGPRETRALRVVVEQDLVSREDHFAHRLDFNFQTALKRFRLDLNVHRASPFPTQVRTSLNLALPPWRDGQFMEIVRMDFEARGFVEIRVPKPERPLVLTSRASGKEYFYAEVPVVPLLFSRPTPKVIGLIWDSSWSGKNRDHVKEFALLDAWFREVQQAEIRLFRINEKTSRHDTYQVKEGNWKDLRAALEATVYDGASSLQGLSDDAKIESWLLFSDGHFNFGEKVHAAKLPLSAVVHTISSAKGSNTSLLQHLAATSNGEYINLAQKDAASAAFALQAQSMRLLAVDVDPQAVAEVYPKAGAIVRGEMLALAGELKVSSTQVRILIGHNRETAMAIELPILSGENLSPLATRRWAENKIEAMLGEARSNQAEIDQVARAFGILTPGATLSLLRSAEEYAEHQLTPPPELRQEWDAYVQSTTVSPAMRKAHLEAVVKAFEDRLAWYERIFPHAKPKRADLDAAVLPHATAESNRDGSTFPRARAGLALRRMAPESDDVARMGRTIVLRRWAPGDPAIERLKASKGERRYAQYLAERAEHSADPAYFLEASDIFFEMGDKDTGLRVLSNILEAKWEDPMLLRMLGHRLMQWGYSSIATDVFEKVLHLRPTEPQSRRDLALACAQAGEPQRAVELLWEIVSEPWDSRFPAVELIALSELNAIVATAAKPLDLSKFDQRLLKNMPLDIRVVLTWDAEDADMDLWIDDPNGQTARYDLPLTYQGGATSHDFTGGYGPEEFILRRAIPGKYGVRINYLGDRRQTAFGPVSAELRIFTGFGTAAQNERRIFLRMKDTQEVISAATFEAGMRKK